MHSIRIKITAITIAAIIISIVALGSIGIYTVKAESDLRSAHEMNLISDDEKQSLDAYLQSLEQSVEMVSNIASDRLSGNGKVTSELLLKKDRTPAEDEQVNAFLQQYRDISLEAFSSVANHTKGIVTYYYCMNPDVSGPENGFFYSKVGNEDFEEQEDLDATTLDPNDLEHYAWYYTPIELGHACWVGPYKAHFLDEVWTVSYVKPLYEDGVLLGVMGMDILLDTMIDKISSVKIYDTGFVALLDAKGRILYHPVYNTGDFPDSLSQALGEETFSQESSAGELIRYEIDGEERQLAYSTLIDGMKIVSVAPVSEITASQRHLTQIIILVAVLLLSAFTVFIILVTRAITKPLTRLTTASQKLADGDYDVALDYEGKDEVGKLTESFRRMRDNLKLSISKLSSQATTDPLTGGKNKNVFYADAERLNKAMGSADPESMPGFAIVMLDCNRLKVINDEYGHAFGDQYLQTAFKAICAVYDHSPVYRIGGDEFAVLLEHGDYERRDELAESFRQLAEETNASAADPWQRVDLSMGMAVYEPGIDTSTEQVLRRADELMYLEKRLYKLSLEKDPT